MKRAPIGTDARETPNTEGESALIIVSLKSSPGEARSFLIGVTDEPLSSAIKSGNPPRNIAQS